MTVAVSTRRASLALPGSCLVLALAYLAVTDPHNPHALMPPCPTKLLTGMDCPLCGGLRVVHDLLHGDLRNALRDNVFLLLMGPLLGWLAWRRVRRPGLAVPRVVVIGVVAAATSWTVLRNLPWWPWKPLG